MVATSAYGFGINSAFFDNVARDAFRRQFNTHLNHMDHLWENVDASKSTTYTAPFTYKYFPSLFLIGEDSHLMR